MRKISIKQENPNSRCSSSAESKYTEVWGTSGNSEDVAGQLVYIRAAFDHGIKNDTICQYHTLFVAPSQARCTMLPVLVTLRTLL